MAVVKAKPQAISTPQLPSISPLWRHTLLFSLILRVILLIIGAYQDTHLPVKYTDVDYYVFTDAAALVSRNISPYQRSTYRYTPLLAYLLLPTVYLHVFGKLLFIAADLVVAALLHRRLVRTHPRTAWRWIAVTWGLNLFVAIISTRGNAESVVVALVLLCVELVEGGQWGWGAVMFGVVVHLKIYPVVHALVFWLALEGGKGGKGVFGLVKRFFGWKRVAFGVLSGGVFMGLGGIMYYIYGHEFLQHTYLYHITRQDHRHNFSLYFYSLYLNSTSATSTSSLLPFIPQLVLITFLGARFAKHDIAFACFAQTFGFVMVNKYFMWYLCYLPMILPGSHLVGAKWRLGVGILLLWVLGQAVWLYFAYMLEHKGLNTFRELFWAGAGFAMCNAVVLGVIVWERVGRMDKREVGKADEKKKKI
ncbi:PIG-M-domain-containing protein [Chytridium lagenaria]|nr:PIG-M-domain-containing protein [Chytridium lagenaria]